MLNPVQTKRYKKGFSAVESSFRIEGLDPSNDPIYRSAKAKILSGEMTPKQALEHVVKQSASPRRPTTKSA